MQWAVLKFYACTLSPARFLVNCVVRVLKGLYNPQFAFQSLRLSSPPPPSSPPSSTFLSQIGMAGHSMKAFFEKRWAQLTQDR